MADFFDKIISGVSKGVENVSTGSKTMVEKAKINTYISTLENEKKQLAELMGIKVYNLFREDKVCKEEVEGFCNEITKRIELITEQKAKLAELDKEKAVASPASAESLTCACGAINPQGSKFCFKCGGAL